MSRTPLNECISDWTVCPHCDAENMRFGGGKNYADAYLNADGQLWAVCTVHNVRWYLSLIHI